MIVDNHVDDVENSYELNSIAASVMGAIPLNAMMSEDVIDEAIVLSQTRDLPAGLTPNHIALALHSFKMAQAFLFVKKAKNL